MEPGNIFSLHANILYLVLELFSQALTLLRSFWKKAFKNPLPSELWYHFHFEDEPRSAQGLPLDIEDGNLET